MGLQSQSLDPQNALPSVVTLSKQEADTREITLAIDEFGHLTLTLDAAEYDRLASLDYTRFDDTQTNAVMADKNATRKLPTARQTFAPEFRFVPNALTLRVGLLATMH